jgi:hypothetical protein
VALDSLQSTCEQLRHFKNNVLLAQKPSDHPMILGKIEALFSIHMKYNNHVYVFKYSSIYDGKSSSD